MGSRPPNRGTTGGILDQRPSSVSPLLQAYGQARATIVWRCSVSSSIPSMGGDRLPTFWYGEAVTGIHRSPSSAALMTWASCKRTSCRGVAWAQRTAYVAAR